MEGPPGHILFFIIPMGMWKNFRNLGMCAQQSSLAVFQEVQLEGGKAVGPMHWSPPGDTPGIHFC